MLSTWEYLHLSQRNAANVAAWAGRTSMSAEESAALPASAQITNDERSALECFEFCAAVPDSYFCYINERSQVASTWTGDRLGHVTFGRQWRDNFGGVRVPITVRAINGRTYHGTYYKSSGDYARLKLSKGNRNG